MIGTKNLCTAFVWRLYGVCTALVWHLYGICMAFVWCLHILLKFGSLPGSLLKFFFKRRTPRHRHLFATQALPTQAFTGPSEMSQTPTKPRSRQTRPKILGNANPIQTKFKPRATLKMRSKTPTKRRGQNVHDPCIAERSKTLE